jgi:N-acetylglutamate synthase-like GNAT family acetyltransferase
LTAGSRQCIRNQLRTSIGARLAHCHHDVLFALTTKSPHWFVERGFVESKVDALPEKKKSLYNYQRNSKIFVKPL